MTVRVADPAGREWVVRRSLIRGKDGRGWRWRWRGPEWLGDLASLLELGQLAEVPVIGPIVLVVLIPVIVVLLAMLLPAIAIGIIEALLLGLLVGLGLVAATLFGRPILIRAQSGDTVHLWAARGWGASKQLRDDVVTAIGRGADPATVHRLEALTLG